jgi:hypothetical protein
MAACVPDGNHAGGEPEAEGARIYANSDDGRVGSMKNGHLIGMEFVQKCLGWSRFNLESGDVVLDDASGPTQGFAVGRLEDVRLLIGEFLGTRYWIQVNRDAGTSGQWRVLIGVQNVAARGASRETVTATNEDLAHGMMEACVLAADTLKLGIV